MHFVSLEALLFLSGAFRYPVTVLVPEVSEVQHNEECWQAL